MLASGKQTISAPRSPVARRYASIAARFASIAPFSQRIWISASVTVTLYPPSPLGRDGRSRQRPLYVYQRLAPDGLQIVGPFGEVPVREVGADDEERVVPDEAADAVDAPVVVAAIRAYLAPHIVAEIQKRDAALSQRRSQGRNVRRLRQVT